MKIQQKAKEKLTGDLYKCIDLETVGDMAQWNKRFTINKSYKQVVDNSDVSYHYIYLLDDQGVAIYVERRLFKKLKL